MKVLFMLDTPMAWQSGIWFHRNETPSSALKSRGHAVRQVAIGKTIPQEMIDWADTAIFGRTYAQHFDPVGAMRQFKKAGKRVLYDIDDDFWQVSKDNPSHLVSNAYKDQYEGLIKQSDAIITPSKYLAKKAKKFKKKAFICPNGIDYSFYRERPRQHKGIIIGYMGAASHWKDLTLIVDVLNKLYDNYDFSFNLYGMVGEPLEASMYYYNRMLKDNLTPEKNDYYKSALEFYAGLKKLRGLHIPFYPPELHPATLSSCDFDIGLAPLDDTEFNKGKSCIKYYEYASVGTVTLASKVTPYKEEVNYTAKNNLKDWYYKLERLIIDEEFREKKLKEQQKWVKENRSLEAIALDWELACQREGGLKVANQER